MPVSRDDYDQWERDSVVSHWSVGDDVRHILYDDVASSIVSIALSLTNGLISCYIIGIHKGSYMSAPKLLNFLNKLRKTDKM